MRSAVNSKHSRLILQNTDDVAGFQQTRIVDDWTIRLIKGSGVDTSWFQPAAEPVLCYPTTRVLRCGATLPISMTSWPALSPALERPADGSPPHALYNLGNHRAEKLTDFIAILEQALGRKAELNLEPMQRGDVPHTYANIEASQHDLGFTPTTPISVGLPKFVDWYRAYYDV